MTEIISSKGDYSISIFEFCISSASFVLVYQIGFSNKRQREDPRIISLQNKLFYPPFDQFCSIGMLASVFEDLIMLNLNLILNKNDSGSGKGHQDSYFYQMHKID